MSTRPSFETFKEKALQNEAVKTEYNALEPIFALKKQMIKARLEAKLTKRGQATFSPFPSPHI